MKQLSPCEVVSAESPKRVQYWRQSPEGWNPLAALSSVSRKVAHEYKNRFVIELLQNAHDAQERISSDGEVQLVLDADEGEHGVFYVANTGKPFTRKNFEALSNIARSSKPPGEGIGNKGLGFRSVLQVCEQPEIYSASPDHDDDGFHGYCFGFATDEEMKSLATDEAEVERLRRDFSRHLLPVLREPQYPRLVELRARGAVTVIRLPLSTADAFESCRAQLQALRSSRAPTLLFLDRVRSVSIEVSRSEDAWRAELLRKRRPCAVGGMSEDVECSEVAVDDQRYLVASRRIASEHVIAAIESGINENELDEDWRHWEGDAEVSLAVRMATAEADEEQPTLYTFLPLRVESPLGAHLNAPFYTNIARVDFAAEIGLNSMFIDVAMGLAAEVLIAITSKENDSFEHRAGMSVDLFSWNSDYLDRFAQVLYERGVNLVESSLLPTGGSRWSSLANAFSWQGVSLSLLDAERLTAVGAHIVDEGIGGRRLARLDAASRHATGASLTAPDEVVAQWLEQVAERLIEHRSSIEEWNRFYEDMAALFQSGRRPGSLRGRRILLDADGRLRRAGPVDYDGRKPSEPVVFVPPRLRSEEDQDADDDLAEDPEELKVPRSLNRAICFLHPDVQLRRREGSTIRRSPVADLLEGRSVAERLAEPFGRRGILAVIRRLLAGDPTPTIRRDALRWVYLQWRSARAGLRGLELLGLQVPTRGGWIPAPQARFSGEWMTPSSRLLERLLAEAEGGASSELEALRASLLVPPGEFPGDAHDVASWERFFSAIGVRDGLWPIALRGGAIEMEGHQWRPELLAQMFQLDEGIAAEWSEHVWKVWPAGRTSHPNTDYTGATDLWILPAQDMFADLSNNARRAYAELVTSAVAEWDPAQFSYRFERRNPRHRGREDQQVWPSPVRTFIERQAWFPMTDPLRRDEPYGVPIGEGWHFDESDGERAPRFARMCSVGLRRRIDASPTVLDALRSHGLRVWNDPSSGPARLEELAKLLEQAFVDGRDTAQFRRACEKAWSDVQRAPVSDEWIGSLPLVVGRDRKLHVLYPGDGQGSQLYVEDGSAGLSLRIVEASGKSILVSDEKDGKELVHLLSNRVDLAVHRISDVAADIVTEIGPVVPGPTTGVLLLDAVGDWLPELVAMAIELQPNAFPPVTERALLESTTRLRRTRFIRARELSVQIDGVGVDLHLATDASLHLDDPEHPVIITLSGQDGINWQVLDATAESIAAVAGHASAAQTLRMASQCLDRLTGWQLRKPSDSELAGTFRVSEHRIAELRAGLHAEGERLAHVLVVPVAVVGGDVAARELEEAEILDRSELFGILAALLGNERAMELVAAAEESESQDGIRRSLKLQLGDFNRALARFGRPPIHYLEQHDAAFRNYVARERGSILDRLRAAFLQEYCEFGDLSHYSTLRTLGGLGPDPRWLDDIEEPDDPLMYDQVQDWFTSNDVPTNGGDSLRPLESVNRHNETLMDSALNLLSRNVAAWCGRQGTTCPEKWQDLLSVRTAFQGSGCLDFAELTATDLARWASVLGLWPDGMPASVDPLELGLSEDDIREASSESNSERERRASEKRLIRLDDRSFSVESDELRALAYEARQSVSPELLATSARRVSLIPLGVPSSGRDGRRGTGGRGGSTRADSEPSNEQKAAIGLVGETVAFEWLIHRYSEANEASWVSKNRAFLLGGYPGDDGLGYDFEVALRTRTLRFEVKATQGEACEFEMGESELRAARAAPQGTYRVLFLRRVLDSTLRQLEVLPNPLEVAYTESFRQVNEGIKLRFALGDVRRSPSTSGREGRGRDVSGDGGVDAGA